MTLPNDDVLRGIVTAYARLLADHGGAFEGAPFVLPTRAFFPDHEGDDLVTAAFERMVEASPLAADLPLIVGFARDDDDDEGEACGTGGCGPARGGGGCGTGGEGKTGKPTITIEDRGEGYAVKLARSEASHPTILACALARSVGALVLLEAGEATTTNGIEIAAAASGLGAFLLMGSHVVSKGCGGVNVRRGTAMDVTAVAPLVALAATVAGHDPDDATRFLDPTAREAYREAIEWVAANDALVHTLREAPKAVADGYFDLKRKGSFWGRLFARSEVPTAASFRASRKARSAEEERRLAEAKALVDDALGAE